ncbi:MAG: cobalt-precorrin 5A hydrolase [Peptococcaceae bacterium]|nr:cobalt-precorrin 5A hydrolase [Peptococcaceae bacterium]
MRIAVLALTHKGAALGVKVANCLNMQQHQAEVFSQDSIASQISEVSPFEGSFRESVETLFKSCDALIMIMALGIVIRTISGHITDKYKDPAVVVMDEEGAYIISALSGHVGGANDLARQIADAIGSIPVITTATDVNNVPALDIFARNYCLRAIPKNAVKSANAALARGENIILHTEVDLPADNSIQLKVQRLGQPSEEAEKFKILVSNRGKINTEKWDIILYPINLVIGLGCKRGVFVEEVLKEIYNALEMIDRSVFSVKALSTIEAKTGEAALIEAAARLEVPLIGHKAEEIEYCIYEHKLTKSDRVAERMGVGGVCEPAAILACPGGKLLLKKTIGSGITVAIAGADCRWWE